MAKIVLIDGHSILNRAFYGVPDLTNSEGLHTNAIYGFLNIMFKILDEEQAEYLAVAFDVSAPTFRHVMYEEYKGTRKPMADELRQQIPVMKQVLEAMGILIMEKPGVEADDVLGTIGKQCADVGMDVSIISGDRDLLQLATDLVKIRIPKTKQGRTEIEDYYADDVLERYQVSPNAFIEVKALMGDSSDNIPGVPSIGEKTATKIIVEYGSIEEAYRHVEELKPPRASKALAEHMELARLCKELATIKVDVPLEFAIEEAKIQNFYTPEAYEFFQRLQFKNLMGRFEYKATNEDVEEYFHVIRKDKDIQSLLERVKTCEKVGISYLPSEESALPLFADSSEYAGIGVALSEKEVYLIQPDALESIASIYEQMTDALKHVASVAMFDVKKKLEEIQIIASQTFELSVAAYLINPLQGEYSYIDIARDYLGITIDEKLEQEKLTSYEAYVSYRGAEVLEAKLKELDLLDLYREVEVPLTFTLYDMERNGIKVEKKALQDYSKELGTKIEELERIIYEGAGHEFNINSPKQLGVVLFEELEMPHGKKTKTGYSTSAEVLEKLAVDYPLVSTILEYRQVAKLKSTYADGLVNYIDEDGRIHGKFNQTITATGRISSTEPNLQNIPVRMEMGRLIRKVFVPQEEYVFVDADYSQIELRILAHASGDEKLIEAYQSAKDIHRITASQVFHTPFDEVSDLQRRNAKAVNFGIVYGISSFGLSQDLSITRKEAQEYINRYFETYPMIKSYLDSLIEFGKKNGYVTTMFGRRRPVPELKSSNFMQRSFGERVAMNAPIQGAAADIMKIAMIRVNDELKKRNLRSRLVLQVHDELLIEAHREEVSIVEEILAKEMSGAAQLKVKLEIDMHTGENWYEAK